MIDFKNTLINLHDTFPEYDLDTLIKIIECIVEYSSGIRRPVLDDPLSNITYNSNRLNEWIDYRDKGIKIDNLHKRNVIV